MDVIMSLLVMLGWVVMIAGVLVLALCAVGILTLHVFFVWLIFGVLAVVATIGAFFASAIAV